MSEPKRMEFWKVIGTKKINGVDAKIQIPTYGKWRNYKAGELIKNAFIDELEKISRATKFVPSFGLKKPSTEEAFYTARRQPGTIQRRIEKVKVETRKKKDPFHRYQEMRK
jgi:hypothetical protein